MVEFILWSLWNCHMMIQFYLSKVVFELNNFQSNLWLWNWILSHFFWGFPCKLISNTAPFSLFSFTARKNLLTSQISDKPFSTKDWHLIIRQIIPLELLTCIIYFPTDTSYINTIFKSTNASTCVILWLGMTMFQSFQFYFFLQYRISFIMSIMVCCSLFYAYLFC